MRRACSVLFCACDDKQTQKDNAITKTSEIVNYNRDFYYNHKHFQHIRQEKYRAISLLIEKQYFETVIAIGCLK